MTEKHTHTGLGSSPGVTAMGPNATILAAADFSGGSGALEFQVEIAGDWVSMGVLRWPKHIGSHPVGVREMSAGRYGFDFTSPQGNYNYRWACTEYAYGEIKSYIAV